MKYYSHASMMRTSNYSCPTMSSIYRMRTNQMIQPMLLALLFRKTRNTGTWCSPLSLRLTNLKRMIKTWRWILRQQQWRVSPGESSQMCTRQCREPEWQEKWKPATQHLWVWLFSWWRKCVSIPCKRDCREYFRTMWWQTTQSCSLERNYKSQVRSFSCWYHKGLRDDKERSPNTKDNDQWMEIGLPMERRIFQLDWLQAH